MTYTWTDQKSQDIELNNCLNIFVHYMLNSNLMLNRYSVEPKVKINTYWCKDMPAYKTLENIQKYLNNIFNNVRILLFIITQYEQINIHE